ncbi:hypothetical protein FQZ97_971260 [compost metagenome]
MAFTLNPLTSYNGSFALFCRPNVSLDLAFLKTLPASFLIYDRDFDLDDFNAIFFQKNSIAFRYASVGQ